MAWTDKELNEMVLAHEYLEGHKMTDSEKEAYKETTKKLPKPILNIFKVAKEKAL
jgi:hypothetical protein